jgi:hypothetical protein
MLSSKCSLARGASGKNLCALSMALPSTVFIQTIIETPAYLSDAKALGLTDAERTVMIALSRLIPVLETSCLARVEHTRSVLQDGTKARVGAIASLLSILATISRSYSTSLPKEKKSI